MATKGAGDAFATDEPASIALITLAAAIAFSSYFKGFLATIPVLLGHRRRLRGRDPHRHGRLPAGRSTPPGSASRRYVSRRSTWARSSSSRPVALVVIVEHIGHLLVVNEIVGKDFTPHAAGVARSVTDSPPRSPAMVGGTPSTTYAENIGVMAVTKVYATQLFWYAGAFAFVIGGFVPKLKCRDPARSRRRSWAASRCCCSASSHSSGLRLLVESGIDYSHSRNLILVERRARRSASAWRPAASRSRSGTITSRVWPPRPSSASSEPDAAEGVEGLATRLAGLHRGAGRGGRRSLGETHSYVAPRRMRDLTAPDCE